MADCTDTDSQYDKECAVLVIAWRRPTETKRLLDVIAGIKPKKLYFACDGARKDRPDEASRVREVRSLIKNVDWDCELRTLFAENNQGCRKGVNRAIDWFYRHEEEGIILEDDCIPALCFFSFCSVMLKRYKDDKRIWSISGTRFSDAMTSERESYYFSRYTHSWGWATWRDRWNCHDKDMGYWMDRKARRRVSESFSTKSEWRHWRKIWHELYFRSKPDTWDYQWSFSARVEGALTVIPRVSMVTNIGFGEDATHTGGISNLATRTESMYDFEEPSSIQSDDIADATIFRRSHKRTWAKNISKKLGVAIKLCRWANQ